MSPATSATVRRYDAATRGGELVRDDGTALALPPGALDAGVRLLRPGQRVRVRLEDGVVVAAAVSGLPFT